MENSIHFEGETGKYDKLIMISIIMISILLASRKCVISEIKLIEQSKIG